MEKVGWYRGKESNIPREKKALLKKIKEKWSSTTPGEHGTNVCKQIPKKKKRGQDVEKWTQQRTL